MALREERLLGLPCTTAFLFLFFSRSFFVDAAVSAAPPRASSKQLRLAKRNVRLGFRAAALIENSVEMKGLISRAARGRLPWLKCTAQQAVSTCQGAKKRLWPMN